MKILFLDQSGSLGGAELCLLDLAKFYQDSCLVGLFVDGSFKEALDNHQIAVRILSTQQLGIRKDSNFWQSISNVGQIIPLINKVIQLSRTYDLIYSNTQKALVVGAIASFLTKKPLIYHLHDILSTEHFSRTNQQIAVFFANRFASLVVANSQASKTAFITAGGKEELVEVVYNGFDLEQYQIDEYRVSQLKHQLSLEGQYIIGHFSRLSPWKGQHILIEALTHCPQATAILVGDALFGEEEYVKQLHEQVERLQLGDRVRFLGFRTDIPELMSMCDLIVHTSTAPEPFGRVIVEAMLCGKPIVASAAGGAIELIQNNHTGWLTTPGNILQLAEIINQCFQQPDITKKIAQAGKIAAIQRFKLSAIEQQIDNLLCQKINN
ncbi:MAG TPA: glycosyltransferase family 4 protein [Coleofasciculaceae cyanobacterium]|jgi:glycosyltransferase involved in cell wall biosynthesis